MGSNVLRHAVVVLFLQINNRLPVSAAMHVVAINIILLPVHTHQLLPLLFQVGHLLRHHHPQQLVAQALLGDHEVEQRDLDGRLRQVVRVAQRGGDVEPAEPRGCS